MTIVENALVHMMRDQSGFGLHECSEALRKCGWNMDAAIRYLQVRGDCVCRRHPDGSRWTDEDYVLYAKGGDPNASMQGS